MCALLLAGVFMLCRPYTMMTHNTGFSDAEIDSALGHYAASLTRLIGMLLVVVGLWALGVATNTATANPSHMQGYSSLHLIYSLLACYLYYSFYKESGAWGWKSGEALSGLIVSVMFALPFIFFASGVCKIEPVAKTTGKTV